MHGQDQERSQIYMGYGSVESLLDRRDPNGTQLFLFVSCEIDRSKRSNVHRRAYYLTVSLVEAGAVHYCRVPYGATRVITDHEGQPVPDCLNDIKVIEARGASLEPCVRAYIGRLGFAPPRDAAPSFPLNLQIIGGKLRAVTLDPRTNLFIPVGEEASS